MIVLEGCPQYQGNPERQYKAKENQYVTMYTHVHIANQ